MKTPIFGPLYVSRSTNLAADRCVNLYPELVETKQGKAVGALYSCPGLDLLLTLTNGGPVQGFTQMGGDLYAVAAGYLYQITSNFVATVIGAVGVPTGPVSMINNGTQIAVFNGDQGFVWSATGGLEAIALPFAPMSPITAAQQDGYGVVNQPGSALWWQSNLLDLSTWNALDFAEASGDPDNVVAMAQVQRTIWLLKQFETEIWYNAGTPGFAFARIDGPYIEAGCAAPASVAQDSENLFWLSQNLSGEGVVLMSVGQEARRISTHGLEDAIRQYPTIADAVGFCYQQDGHAFYQLSFPTGDATWVYDKTASALSGGVPMWHERASFANGLLHRHRANCHVFFAGKNIVGDYQNGNLYALDLDTYTDNGAAIKRLRAWRAAQQSAEQPVRFSQLRIDMETGMTAAPGANPLMTLRYSDDGAHNWSVERYASAGALGQTAQRVMFRRLGSTRRNSGLDRIFELSTTDAFRVAIVGAELQ